MKGFLHKISAFAITFIVIVFALLTLSSAWVKQKGFSNHSTESNLLFLSEKERFDLMFLGISHARNFSRQANHNIVEKVLDQTIINLGQGEGACGPKEQLFYFDYFMSRGNLADQVIYVLSPPMLFSETLPIASNTFDNEPFEFFFLWRYVFFKSENKSARIISYLQTKLRPNWLFLSQPERSLPEKRTLTFIDTVAIKKGQEYAYGGLKINMQRYKAAIQVVEQTIQLAKQNNTKIMLMIPPALFGKWRGHQQTLKFAKEMQIKYANHVTVFDASETILEPKYYYDNHHLNTAGVRYFVKTFLKPVL